MCQIPHQNTSPNSFWYSFPRILRHGRHDTRNIPDRYRRTMLDSFNCIHGIGQIAANWSSDMRTRIIKLFKSTFITKKYFTPMFMGPCCMFRTKLQSSFSHFLCNEWFFDGFRLGMPNLIRRRRFIVSTYTLSATGCRLFFISAAEMNGNLVTKRRILESNL